MTAEKGIDKKCIVAYYYILGITDPANKPTYGFINYCSFNISKLVHFIFFSFLIASFHSI